VDPHLRQIGIAVIGALSGSLRSDKIGALSGSLRSDKILLDKISPPYNAMGDALYNQDGVFTMSC
jgi:hypothetical protein